MIQVVQNRHRLTDRLSSMNKCWHLSAWIEVCVVGLVLLSATIYEMNGTLFVGDAFKPQRDSHAIRGGTAKISIKNEIIRSIHAAIVQYCGAIVYRSLVSEVRF